MGAVELSEYGGLKSSVASARGNPLAQDDERRILLVEDVPADAELTVRELYKGGIPFTWRRVQTEVGLRRAIREFQPTLILSDFTLPQFDGLKALQISCEIAPHTAFIFVSGSIGEERAIDALQKGATDYVLKSNLKRLVPAVTRALKIRAAALVQATLPKAIPLDFKQFEESKLSSAATLERRAFEKKLYKAVALRQFEVRYQPKICVRTRHIEGVEALLHWRDPDAGLIAPAAFLPWLDSSGLILELQEWILDRVMQDCQHWQHLGLPPIRTAVNISKVQLRQPGFAHRFLQMTRPWSHSFCGLEVEIVEAALLGDCAADVKKLSLLRSAGIHVAIDDFGSGLSSLSTLSDLPIDSLKIDKTFIDGLCRQPSAQTVVATIISLARGLRLSVSAEGVETLEQLELLRQMGCDQSQGYLHSKPVTCDEFSELLLHGRGWVMLPAQSGANSRTWDDKHSVRVNAV